jgi:hypothetical protein
MPCNNYFVPSGRLLNKLYVAQTFEIAVVQPVEAVAWAVGQAVEQAAAQTEL